MIEVNLLPKITKKNIEKNAIYTELANNMIVIGLAVGLLTILLLVTNRWINFNVIKMQTAQFNTKDDTEIRQINSELNQIEAMQKDYIKWSRVATDFWRLVPAGVRLSAVTIDKETSRLEISGIADKRDDFLHFKDNLERADLVEKVDSPITNILRQTDVDFSLVADLKF